jgi:predicted transcriptional regulator
MCIVSGISHGAPGAMWASVRDRAGVNEEKYLEYALGAQSISALRLEAVSPLVSPVSLRDLKSVCGLGWPPQSFRYIDGVDVEQICGSQLFDLSASLDG